jgi:steroid 5-alpha reductase family enzyme
MFFYRNFSTEAFVYLALHGTYSVLWLLKHHLYPDRRFEQRQPFGIGVIFIFLPLGAYYAAPYLLITRRVTLPPDFLAAVICVYTLGVFFHYVADAQKYFTLRERKGLITDGLFGRTRNPNYLGEILIYVAFAAMARHWLPFAVLAGWTLGFFVRNMLAKDRSLSRYPEFAPYRARTGLLLPRILPPR